MTAPSDEPHALPDEDAKPFLDHLEELRGTLLACLGTLVVAMVICACFVPQILAILEAPLAKIGKDPTTFLISFRVAGPFSVLMRVAAWSGLLLSMPFIVFFVARFVFPGLTDKEKRVLTRASGFAVVLFIMGVSLGYFYCIPIALKMMLALHDWMGVVAQWTINDYVSFTVQLLLGFGLAFQLPVLVLILGKLGIVTHSQLRKQRRFVIIGCLVVGMMMTPADVASQMILAIPLYFLFEICIWILWLDERRAKGDGMTNDEIPKPEAMTKPE